MKLKYTKLSLAVPFGLALAFTSASASAATRTWGGGNLLWSNTSASGWNAAAPVAADTAIINSGTVTFHTNDVYGNAATTSSAAITINTGGTVASGAFFNTLWNLTLGGGTLSSNGGVNASYGTYNLAGTVTAAGGVTSTISTGSGSFNIINLGNGNTAALTNTTFDVGAAGTLNVGTVLQNHRYETLSTQISAAGLIKTGAGTMTLSNINTYTGATTVNAGKLTVSAGNINTTSAVSIGAGNFNYNSATALSKGVSFSGTGGTLSGTGTITPSVTISAGNTLAPGNSIGTLTFGTNLTLAGTYSVELGTVNANPALSLSDRTVVTGTLALGGNLTLVDNAGANGNGSAAAGAYRIATSTGATSGTFASVTNPMSATLHEKVVYGTNTTDVNLYRLATGSTSAVNLGKTRVGGTLTGSLTTTNSATADGFSERLNATVSTNTGNVNASSGTVSGVIAGANASSISVGLDTSSIGTKTGTVLVSYASDGTGTSGYGTTANGSQTVGVTGDVYALAFANLAQTAGVAITGSSPTYALDFGTGLSLNTLYTASFSIQNGAVVNSFIDTLTGDYGLTGAPEFGTTAVDFNGLAAGAAANAFNITFYTTSGGAFAGSFNFDGTSVQSGLSDVSVGDFSISLAANAVPEPGAALIGSLGLLALLRRRR